MANNLGAILCGGENLLCDFSHIFSRTCGKRHNALSEKDGSIKCEGKFSKEHNIVKNSKDEINICGKNNYDVSGCYNTCNDEKEYIYDGQPTKFSINNIYLNFKNNKTENEKILNDVTKLGNEICDEKINCICIKSGAREQNNCGENYYQDNNPVQETYNFGNVDNSIALNNSNCSKNNNIKNDDNESNNIMEPQTHNNDNFPKTDISSINNNESSYPSSEFMSVVSCGKVDE